MYSRNLELPLNEENSLFLFGPRGTGKTKWIKSHLENDVYLDLLDFSLYRELKANPSRLSKLIPPNYQDWVVIDEVQEVPELLNEVHRLIEAKHYKFLLTGSSARKLRRKGTNLLAGRALRYHMHPLIFQELGEDFSLEHALSLGLLPATFSKSNPSKYIETYVETYLREEVLQEGLTRNIGAFAHFLEVASFSQGTTINMSEIARELGIDRQVVANYFSILEDMLLSIRVPVFSRRAKRKLVAHPKFYYFDVGVYKSLRPKGPLDTAAELNGAALETLFLQSIRAVNDYNELGYAIHYWRTNTGVEVDFVLYGEHGLHAFEIKHASRVTPRMLRSLRTFKQDYPPATLYLIYQGNHVEYHGDITVLPIEVALKQLPDLLT